MGKKLKSLIIALILAILGIAGSFYLHESPIELAGEFVGAVVVWFLVVYGVFWIRDKRNV